MEDSHVVESESIEGETGIAVISLNTTRESPPAIPGDTLEGNVPGEKIPKKGLAMTISPAAKDRCGRKIRATNDKL